MTDRARAGASWVLRATVTGACAWWIFSGSDLDGFVDVLGASRPVPAVLGIALFALTGALMGVRWQWMVREHAPSFRAWTAVRLTYEGMFYGLVLPTAVGGDMYRLVQVRDVAGLGRGATTLVMERLFGLWGLCVLVLTGLLLRSQAVGDYGWAAGGLSGAILVGSLVVLVPGASGLAAWASARVGLSRLSEGVSRGSDHARGYLANLPLAARLFGGSLLIHLVGIASVALLAAAVGLHPPPVWFLVAVPTAWIVAMVPALGGFGPREQALAVLLVAVGASSERALAIVGLQAVAIVTRSLVGGAFALLPR